MAGKIVEYPADSRTASGYLATPALPAAPALVVIQEWWGLVDHIRDLVDRFAAAGFVTIAPDLYHGEQTSSPDKAGKMLMALNIAQAAKEIEGAAEYLLQMEQVEPKNVGVLGFCMGGQLALYSAAEYPDLIAAAVDFYGIHPNVKIDPSKMTVPLLAHFAERDKSVPAADAHALVDQIRDAGGNIEAHFYDADHAFFNDTRPEVYSPDDARLAWERTVDFLRKHLS